MTEVAVTVGGAAAEHKRQVLDAKYQADWTDHPQTWPVQGPSATVTFGWAEKTNRGKMPIETMKLKISIVTDVKFEQTHRGYIVLYPFFVEFMNLSRISFNM